jgi:hypothetical protein
VTGALTNAAATTNAYVAKFDPFCNWRCTGLLPTFVGGPDVGNGITVNVDGVGYITGAFTIGATTNAFVALFFPSCDFFCSMAVPSAAGGPDSGNAIAMDPAQDGYLAGAMFNGAFTDAFVDKYDLACNPLCQPTILSNPN